MAGKDMLTDLIGKGEELSRRQEFQGIDPRQARRHRAKELLATIAKRKKEGLYLYRPLPISAKFHRCGSRIRVLDGSNQSGKTLTAEVEVARAVMGLDAKFPRHNGRALIVGYDGDHLADPMFRTLTEPGAYSIIRDEHTKQWRSVRVDPKDPRKLDPYDAAYREKWQESEPLLPPRMITGRSWESRKDRIPRNITLATGWQMLWRSSKGKPVRGRQFHLWHFDEEVNNDEFLVEARRGSMRRGALGFWSATPQTGGMQLYNLRRRADAGSENVKAFTLLLADNPFYPEQEKQAFIDGLSREEAEVRVFGKYAIVGRKVYPYYDPMGEHGYEPRPIPADYCRELILDPGRQHCGTIFGAIDPDEAHAWVYDAFDLRNTDANGWADHVVKRIRQHGGGQFERWIIDQQMGKQRSSGQAETVAWFYFQALTARGVYPRRTGPLDGFFEGSNDVPAREEALLDWMTVRHEGPHTGTSRLQVARGMAPELDDQIANAQMDSKNPKKRKQGKELPEDVLVCLEYWAASNPVYRLPESQPAAEETRLMRALRRKQQATRTKQSTCRVG
ncbi:MAG TPA: hypothetical protein ENH80_10025 [Phycisphaerae bacterium]|nr:hypothetical protein [Phycisphaerae bacterium]